MDQAPIPLDQKFNDTQKQDIILLYKSGSTHKEIALKFNVSFLTIRKLLDKLGIHKSNSEAQKSRFEPGFIKQVNELRSKGMKLTDIVISTGRSLSAVSRACKKIGVQKPRIQFGDLTSEYNSGLNLADLAKNYNTSVSTIVKELDKIGVQRRPALLPFTGTIQKRITNLSIYNDTKEWYYDAYITRKHSLTQIARFINKSIGFVSGRLIKYDISVRSISEGVRRMNPDDVILAYQNISSMSKVADQFNCTTQAISDILEKNNIVIRTTSEILSGEGNPFYGKKHSDEIKKRCASIGLIYGTKFWKDHPEYVEVVREKQKLLWADLEKRRLDSQLISKLRQEGKLKPKSGMLSNRFGNIGYDSTWELELIKLLDKDNRVVLLERDFCLIEYEFNDGIHHFVPDFRVWLENLLKRFCGLGTCPPLLQEFGRS
jgi:Mor family transcriptional regulator